MKRIIWISASLLIVIALAVSYTSMKKHFAMQQIKEIQTEEKEERTTEDELPDEEEVDKTEDEHTEEPAEQAVTAEDPVRDFLSEKVDKAITRLFKKDISIVAIGDSLTQGVGDEADNAGYVGILEDTINQERDLIDIQNFGKRGNRSDQLIARLDDSEIDEALSEADIILITIGANDVMQIFKQNFTDLQLDQFNTGKDQFETRLHYIFSEMETNNAAADIYLIGFYNPFKQYFENIDELEEIINNWSTVGEEAAEEYDQVSYIPIKDLFDDTSINYLSNDNFHPNHLGYELMAERILEFIVDKGGER